MLPNPMAMFPIARRFIPSSGTWFEGFEGLEGLEDEDDEFGVYATISTPATATTTENSLSHRSLSLSNGIEKAYAKNAEQLKMAVKSLGVVSVMATYHDEAAMVMMQVI